MSTTHWKAYQSYMSSAKRFRDRAIRLAQRRDWNCAYAHAETAKTAQVSADKYFNLYLDGLALDDTYTCTSCHRPELDCSLNPCDAVQADRIS